MLTGEFQRNKTVVLVSCSKNYFSINENVIGKIFFFNNFHQKNNN